MIKKTGFILFLFLFFIFNSCSSGNTTGNDSENVIVDNSQDVVGNVDSSSDFDSVVKDDFVTKKDDDISLNDKDSLVVDEFVEKDDVVEDIFPDSDDFVACQNWECGVDHGVKCGVCDKNSKMYCDDSSHKCLQACQNMECGLDHNIGCGVCDESKKMYCDNSSHKCLEACQGMECGMDNNVFCGSCNGTFYCDDKNLCKDACKEVECGIWHKKDCGGCVDSVCTSKNECKECEPGSKSIDLCQTDDKMFQRTSCSDLGSWTFVGDCFKTVAVPTNQTRCYDNSKEIKCPEADKTFFGQDGNYKDAKRVFSVSNEIVTDSFTGLKWQKGTASSKMLYDNAVNYCKNLTIDGESGWRLPTATELQTLIDYGRINPAINTKVFPTKYDEPFISIVKRSGYDQYAGIDFSDGEKHFYNNAPVNKAYVRCVKGNVFSYPQNFVKKTINSEEVVVDDNSGLMWSKTASKTMKWASALSYCEHLNYAGFSDWRLPNVNELLTAMGEKTTTHPFISQRSYLASTTYVSDVSKSWNVNFKDDYRLTGAYTKTPSHLMFSVICVR